MIEPNNIKEKALPSFKKYSRKYCEKAKCIFHSKLSCESDLYPTNNNKAKKLHKSTGYCEQYQSERESEFRKVILGNLKAEKERITKRLNTEISKIEQIPQIEFNHNIASPLFNPTDLTILISIENNLDKYYRPKKDQEEDEEEEEESQIPIAKDLEDHQLLVANSLVEDIDSRYAILHLLPLERAKDEINKLSNSFWLLYYVIIIYL